MSDRYIWVARTKMLFLRPSTIGMPNDCTRRTKMSKAEIRMAG
jgi:hypothetical protein